MRPILLVAYRTRRWLRNCTLVQLWRDAPREITTWGKIWRTVLFVGFCVIVIYFIGVVRLIGGGYPTN